MGQGDLENCLPELAEFMATTDLDNDPTTSKQIAITYTIGFVLTPLEAKLMIDTASKGGGTYALANDAAGLVKALAEIAAQCRGSECNAHITVRRGGLLHPDPQS